MCSSASEQTTVPIGAEGVVLTAERSLAVDRAFIALGLPIWLEAEERFAAGRSVRRLVVAQDTGGAIKGPVRGDLFWGTGTAAAWRGRSHERARPLLPAVAPRRCRTPRAKRMNAHLIDAMRAFVGGWVRLTPHGDTMPRHYFDEGSLDFGWGETKNLGRTPLPGSGWEQDVVDAAKANPGVLTS